MVKLFSVVDRRDDIAFRVDKFIEEFAELQDEKAKSRIISERQDCFYTLALLCNALGLNISSDVQYWVNSNRVLLQIVQINTKPSPDKQKAVNDAYRWLISGWHNVESELGEAYKRLVDNEYEIK